MKPYRVLLLSLSIALAACSRAPEAEKKAEAPPPHAKVGAWGFDMEGMDKSVAPGDDFFKYANGKWKASATIPPDLGGWGEAYRISIETEKQIHDLVEELPKEAAAGTPEQKVRDFYGSYLDLDTIE